MTVGSAPSVVESPALQFRAIRAAHSANAIRFMLTSLAHGFGFNHPAWVVIDVSPALPLHP
ncbi:hypothetical protein, partial [Pseudomonas aeruginosa]|uniref:hypothetical protein n=1 Tax=Pseudomonas aeruginosa TaxID=287 RepID=UPI001F258445